MGKKGIEQIIDEMEVYINDAKTQPLSQTKIVIHREEMLEYINELKLKMPSEIERCKKIMRNRDSILSEARTRSDAIISDSINEANRLVEQHKITELANARANDILDMARSQAQQIVDQATAEATEIRMGAMTYTKDKLTEMHELCAKITAMEKENYETLIQSMEDYTYTLEGNMNEMDSNIGLLSDSSSMSYADEDELDSAFADDVTVNPAMGKNVSKASDDEDEDDEDEDFEEDDDEEEDDEDDDSILDDDEDDDFLDE